MIDSKTMHVVDFADPLWECYIQEEKLYSNIQTYAEKNDWRQTLHSLSFAREKHAGQTRKGDTKIPYIYHPLLVAYHAISLGFDEDDIVATAILHDVCEDCSVAADNLPVNDKIKTAVSLLTKSNEKSTRQYYGAISQNKIATIVKMLDRCNNVSDMTKGFSREKIRNYIDGTEKYVYPLIQIAKANYPEYAKAIFLIEYHMVSVVTSVKCMVIEE